MSDGTWEWGGANEKTFFMHQKKRQIVNLTLRGIMIAVVEQGRGWREMRLCDKNR